MKRLIPLSLIAASTLCATTISLNGGWNLTGAIDGVNPSDLNQNCVKTVWAYDPSDSTNPWKLYSNLSGASDNNHGFPQLSYINQGQGFWVNASCPMDISYNDDNNGTTGASQPSSFDKYGFHWTTNYTHGGNGLEVGFNSAYPELVRITANKVEGDRARTDMMAELSNKASSASAQIELNETSTEYNRVLFRTSSDVTLTEQKRSELQLSSTDVKAFCTIGIKGKVIYASVKLEDAQGNEKKVFPMGDENNVIYDTDDSSNIINKWIEVKLTNNDNNSMSFSAYDVNNNHSQIGDTVTFNRPDGVSAHGIEKLMIRAEIDDRDNVDAGDTVQAQIRSVSASYNQDQDDDMDVNSTEVTTLSFNDTSLTSWIGLEDDADDEYMVFTKNGSSLTVEEYELEDGNWENDGTESGTITVNSDTNASVYFSGEGFGADIIVKKTEQIHSIDDMNFTDLYRSEIEFIVTNPGSGWTDTWDWSPKYYDNATQQDVNVTTNDQLLTMFLTQNHWFGDDNYAMLEGNTSDTSGNIVEGYVTSTFTCDNDNDGISDDTCKNVQRTSNVIGSWTYNSANGIELDMPKEIETLSMVYSEGKHVVQSHGQDKNGSVWQEEIFTGSEATETLIRNILSK